MRAWVAVCVLLPAALASASEVRIAVRGATRVEAPAVTRLGNWEVDVSFDPILCEVSCVYRLRTDRYGRTPVVDLLLPPAIDLRVVFGNGSTTFTVDPAHTRDPRVGARGVPVEDAAALSAWHGPKAPAPAATSITPVAVPRPPDTPAVPRLAPLPLRV
jgi:hypothetical protein